VLAPPRLPGSFAPPCPVRERRRLAAPELCLPPATIAVVEEEAASIF